MNLPATAKSLHIEISANDKLISLIAPNIRYTYKGKALDNIIRLFTLIAGGTPKKIACEMTGLSYSNLKRWQVEDWYDQAITIIKERMDMALDDNYTAVVHRATGEVLDRLEHGDVIIGKNGEQIRRPVTAKDAMLVAGIAHDKRNLLRGKPTTITESQSEGDRLKSLAEKFKNIAEGKMFDIDGELVDGQEQE